MTGWGFFFLILLVLFLAYAAWAAYIFISARRRGDSTPPARSFIPFYGSQFRSQSSTNYPTPRASGPVEWIKDQFSKLRHGGSSRGAYAEATGDGPDEYAGLGGRMGGAARAGGRGGRGLEDDTWDARVEAGDEERYGAGPGGIYEEQELGLAPTPGYAHQPYGDGSDYLQQSTGYAGASSRTNVGGATPGERGRTLTPADASAASAGHNNPFSDEHAAPSLRSVSPRPHIDTSVAAAGDHEQRGQSQTHKTNASLDSTQSSPTSIRKSHFQERI